VRESSVAQEHILHKTHAVIKTLVLGRDNATIVTVVVPPTVWEIEGFLPMRSTSPVRVEECILETYAKGRRQSNCIAQGTTWWMENKLQTGLETRRDMLLLACPSFVNELAVVRCLPEIGKAIVEEKSIASLPCDQFMDKTVDESLQRFPSATQNTSTK
jgi:hypothetical protein